MDITPVGGFLYNACLLNNISIHPKDIIWFLEVNNYMVLNGVFGCFPNGIRDFFLEHNVQVHGTNLSGAIPFVVFKELSQNSIKEYPAVIILYWHGGGAHYVALNWDESLSQYLVYNHYSDKNSIEKYDNLISGEGELFWESQYQLWAWYVMGETQ